MNQMTVNTNQVSTKVSGPTLFEIAYLEQLQKELSIFLGSRNFPTLEAIVVGVKGNNYQLLIPVKGVAVS